MWITSLLVTLVWLSGSRARDYCDDLIHECIQNAPPWTRCYEDGIVTCTVRGRGRSDFVRVIVNSSLEAEVRPTVLHSAHIPSSALQMSKGVAPGEEVWLVATVINSTFFKPSPQPPRGRGRALIPPRPTLRHSTVLEGLVLVVTAGNSRVSNLQEPVILTFKHNKKVEDGACVFWQESHVENWTGHWSTEGCSTSITGTEFICSCNHLSFFAVLVNPELSVDKSHAVTLSYITYIGSALSIFFLVISLIIYMHLQRRRPEKAIGVHMQLTVAMFCLHLSFLLCSLLAWLLSNNSQGWVCKALGLFLHWSLLATISWTALEGFHLYLLLVRVFNIYVRRYLLKLSLVGWGLPTLTVAACGVSGVYGKYGVTLLGDDSRNSTAEICWISSEFPHRLIVSYVTTVAFPCLVIMYNFCMLGMVVFKLWGLRSGSGGAERNGSWKKMSTQNGSRLWKDCATVLGLSCVLGLTWALASATYISLPGIYAFTILNSLQGVFMFLWSLALSCKSRSDHNSSSRDPSSSQKMMTTSFNN